jgi:hypothetical protein
MAAFIFTCPNTNLKVEHIFQDDDEDAADTEYEVITCPACTRLHFINPKTRKLLGANTE